MNCVFLIFIVYIINQSQSMYSLIYIDCYGREGSVRVISANTCIHNMHSSCSMCYISRPPAARSAFAYMFYTPSLLDRVSSIVAMRTSAAEGPTHHHSPYKFYQYPSAIKLLLFISQCCISQHELKKKKKKGKKMHVKILFEIPLFQLF
jgi:molybdopterin/thiamine biosynthesis adenylyltransferase